MELSIPGIANIWAPLAIYVFEGSLEAWWTRTRFILKTKHTKADTFYYLKIWDNMRQPQHIWQVVIQIYLAVFTLQFQINCFKATVCLGIKQSRKDWKVVQPKWLSYFKDIDVAQGLHSIRKWNQWLWIFLNIQWNFLFTFILSNFLVRTHQYKKK